jgi:hypothetical protein
MAILPGVLGPHTLRRTVPVSLGFDVGYLILDFGLLTTIMISNLPVQILPFIVSF